MYVHSLLINTQPTGVGNAQKTKLDSLQQQYITAEL